MKERFLLAPMSKSILILTLVLWLIPIGFLFHYLHSQQPLSGILSVLLLVLYLVVWLFCRPHYFGVSENNLLIQFPAWKRRISLTDISAITLISRDEFKEKYGLALRIGVGGLWGGFGWLWTSKKGLIEFYVSRTDGLVMIQKTSGKDILITPDEPKKFQEFTLHLL